ncbi:MAG: response regulator [Burkholderiales bacterium]
MSFSQQALATVNGLASAALMRMGRLITRTWAFERHAVPSLVHDDNPFRDRPRILVVDDHLEHRLLLEAMLYRWSIVPVHAADGAEAVALACGQHFDLILMDLQMPILDGLTATAQIRGFERRNDHPRAPIVAYTSSTLGDDWSILRACGFDESLDKPCSSRSLEECMQRWCGSGSAQASSRASSRRSRCAVESTPPRSME